jgi:aryl-alcohol dehydrogenase-like predicted oxidoreductase
MSDDPGDTGLSRAHILKSCEASLRRLGTDYIDLYQIHSYDPNTPLEETLEALDSLVRAGKVRFIGCSNLAAWQLMKAKHLSAILQLNSFISAQMYYSIGVRDIEHEIVPLCLDQHIGILCWSPLSGGFFTGKYQREHLTPKNSRRSHREASSLKYWFLDEEKGFSILAALEPMSQNRQVSVAQLALSWLLYKPAVTSLVIGARNEKQLLENIAAADLSVSREEMNELDKVSEPYIPYPMSHQLLGE